MDAAAKETVAKKLRSHDWYYSYSDDYSVVKRGERSWNELISLCRGVPVEELRPMWMKLAPPEFHRMFEVLFNG